MSQHYIYLWIRKDLSREQQIIQAGHAMHLIGLNQGSKEIPNAVLFGASDKHELQQIAEFLDYNRIRFEMFFEPDIKEDTAIATYPLVGDQRKLFEDLETLSYATS